MRKGDIVTIDFPFTDLSGKKVRPALVLTADEVDVTVAFITSKLFQARPPDVVLQPDVRNGLKSPSVVRTNKFATLNQRLLKGKIGELTPAELIAVDAGLLVSLAIEVPEK